MRPKNRDHGRIDSRYNLVSRDWSEELFGVHPRLAVGLSGATGAKVLRSKEV